MTNSIDMQYKVGPSDDCEVVRMTAAALDTLAEAQQNADRLRILWVKVGGLWPVNTGGRLRSFNLIKELSAQHELDVLTTHHPAEDGGALKAQIPRCSMVKSLPHAMVKRNSAAFIWHLMRSWFTPLPVDVYKCRIEELGAEVNKALQNGNYDLCIADFLVAAPNVPMRGKVPIVYFSHNVEYMIWKRLAQIETNPVRRALLDIEWRKMRRFETRTCADAALSIAVSQEDCAQLSDDNPAMKIRAIPTGVDIEYFKPSNAVKEKPLELVFTGSMDWHPNEDAILYFIDSILPLIRSELPGVTLTVAGRNPSAKLRSAAEHANVTITGTVADVRPHIERAAVYIVPLRVGGGTRLKIFEALAMGKAVVSTTIGAEGLPLQDDVHVVRADTPQTFANAVLTLLRDKAGRDQLGANGRQLMEDKFSWPKVAQQFAEYCAEVRR